MSIGFIPSNDHAVHEHTELTAASNERIAWQVADAWALQTALKDAYQALLRDARKCA